MTREDLYENDAIWARFYRDGRTLEEICSEFNCNVWELGPWLSEPLSKAAHETNTEFRKEVEVLRRLKINSESAVMAERERCAVLAEGDARTYDVQKLLASGDDWLAADVMARIALATVIRSGE